MKRSCRQCQLEFEVPGDSASAPAKCPTCGAPCDIGSEVVSRGEPAPAPSRQWMLRRADGTTTEFSGAGTLQKWIVEGKVSREDQFSRDGGVQWQRLDSI